MVGESATLLQKQAGPSLCAAIGSRGSLAAGEETGIMRIHVISAPASSKSKKIPSSAPSDLFGSEVARAPAALCLRASPHAALGPGRRGIHIAIRLARKRACPHLRETSSQTRASETMLKGHPRRRQTRNRARTPASLPRRTLARPRRPHSRGFRFQARLPWETSPSVRIVRLGNRLARTRVHSSTRARATARSNAGTHPQGDTQARRNVDRGTQTQAHSNLPEFYQPSMSRYLRALRRAPLSRSAARTPFHRMPAHHLPVEPLCCLTGNLKGRQHDSLSTNESKAYIPADRGPAGHSAAGMLLKAVTQTSLNGGFGACCSWNQ